MTGAHCAWKLLKESSRTRSRSRENADSPKIAIRRAFWKKWKLKVEWRPLVYHSQEHSSAREGNPGRKLRREPQDLGLAVGLCSRHQYQNWGSVTPRLGSREKLDHAWDWVGQSWFYNSSTWEAEAREGQSQASLGCMKPHLKQTGLER